MLLFPTVIRLTFLWLVILGILGYTWKDWYRGICGLIVLMAIIEHPDMPRSILGIPGLNPWNLLLFNGILAWMVQRPKEGLRLDLPRHITVMLLLYLAVVIVGFIRIIGDTSNLRLYYREDMTYFFTEYLINTVKWVIPGLLLYDGCRTEERFRLALFSILSVFVLLSIQVAKWMPPQYALNADALERRSLKVLVNGIGYHRVNLSAMLSGASWAILCTTVLVPKRRRWLVLFAALFVIYAQMMTGGRAGYGAWVAVGLVMCFLKWRRYLVLIPAAAVLAMLLLPGVVGRALQGFTVDSHDTNTRLEKQEREQVGGDQASSVDSYTVTAGRSLAWPLIVEKIRQRPLVGYGRQAMLRVGITTFLYETLGEVFPHPHNAYLEMLLDNGIIGFVIVLSFYAVMLFYSVRLFLDRDSPSCSAIGGVSTALMLGLLVSSLGSQTFYPREGWDGMWAAMLIGLRVRIERRRLKGVEAAVQAPAPESPPVRRIPRFAGPLHARTAAGRAPVPVLAKHRTAAPASRRVRPAFSLGGHRGGPGADADVSAVPGLTATAPHSRPTLRPSLRAQRTAAPVAAVGLRTRSLGMRRAAGIAHSGFFGTTVIDPLVWERA